VSFVGSVVPSLLYLASDHLPMFPVKHRDSPYLERYYLFELRGRTYFLHRFVADDPAGLHDHPWKDAYAMILWGEYDEDVPPTGPRVYTQAVTEFEDERVRAGHPPFPSSDRAASRAFDTLPKAVRDARIWKAQESLMAEGVYDTIRRTAWKPRILLGSDRHRVKLVRGQHVWTVFVTGKKVKTWGQWKDGVYEQQSGKKPPNTGPGAAPRDWPKGRVHPDRLPLQRAA